MLPVEYLEPSKKFLEKAKGIIGEPDDVPLLAIALEHKIPVWTNDKDFENTAIELITTEQLVEKLRCILSLTNLLPSLARRFPFHFAPFGLTALTALRNVLLKNRRLVRKKKLFSFQPTLLFKKQIAECHQDWRKPP